LGKRKNKELEIPSLSQLESARANLRHRSRYRRTFRSTVYVLIVVAAVAALVATLWMPVLQIYGSSMSPTLRDGEIVVCVRADEFDTGELAAFYYGNKLLVKRVICGPADWIDIRDDGTVFINSKELDEPYLVEKALGESDLEYPYQVPDERWFLMGDNRAVSVDSRSDQVGCVAEEQIVGRIVFRVWPLAQFGPVDTGIQLSDLQTNLSENIKRLRNSDLWPKNSIFNW